MKVPRRTFDRTHLWQTWHAGIQDSGLNIWGLDGLLLLKTPYKSVWPFSFSKGNRHTSRPSAHSVRMPESQYSGAVSITTLYGMTVPGPEATALCFTSTLQGWIYTTDHCYGEVFQLHQRHRQILEVPA